MKIYLAGPMRYCSLSQKHDWRDLLINNIEDYIFLDPTVETNHKNIVKRDLRMIDDSDIVLANCWIESVGTSMEIMYAYMNNKFVIVIDVRGNVSDFVKQHCHLYFESIEECISTFKSN